jgi:hypothetical protein
VVISLPQVERQAGEAGNPADHELAMLTVHGVLHLLGYDHERPDEEKVMSGKTGRILAEVFSVGDHAVRPDRKPDPKIVDQTGRRQPRTDWKPGKATPLQTGQRVAGLRAGGRVR